MKLLIDPPSSQWTLVGKIAPSDLAWLSSVVSESAPRMGTAILPDPPRIIATGHQAWFWHPGILAKDLAAAAMARRSGAAPLHVVVDHDEHMGNTLDLPYREGDQVKVRTLTLGSQDPATPTCCQAAWHPKDVIKSLREVQREMGERLLVDISPMVSAWEAVSRLNPSNLAEQITAVMFHDSPLSTIPVLLSSDLARSDAFLGVVQRIVADPLPCVETYNAAAKQHPDAGIALLRIESAMTEVPLWAVSQGIKSGPRLRLFVKPAGPASAAQLIDETGRAFDPKTHRILPRALLLSALMRRYFSDLFIHGKGGGEYDQITNTWWTTWRNEPLNPRAVVSADLFLPFDFAPLATPADLARAIWRRRHVVHNPDREPTVLAQDSLKPLIDEKRRILATIKSAPDRHERTRLFGRLHELNDAMVLAAPTLVPQAQNAILTARAGIANQATTQRRDWYFGFYSSADLTELADKLSIAFSL